MGRARRRKTARPFLVAVCFPEEVYARAGERDYLMVQAWPADVSQPPSLELYEPGDLDAAIDRARELAGRRNAFRQVDVADASRVRLAWFGALWVRDLYPGS